MIKKSAAKIFATLYITVLISTSVPLYAQNMPADTHQTAGADEVSNSAPSATSPAKTPVPRAKVDVGKEALSLLAAELTDDQILWLEGNTEKFLAVWEPDKTGNPFGAALLLHGQGQSAETPHTVQALRNNLSRHGWATLAISLPTAKEKKVPSRKIAGQIAANEEPTADALVSKSPVTAQENPEKAINPEEVSDARIRSGIAFLNQQGQYNIVIIGHGIGAVRAARFINSTSSTTSPIAGRKTQRSIRALVMVQARNRVPATHEDLISLLNDPSLPILDIYFGDHYLDTLDVKSRKNMARDKRIKSYFQVKIMRPATSDDISENRLTRRVRGFLGKHAKGVAIERRRSGS